MVTVRIAQVYSTPLPEKANTGQITRIQSQMQRGKAFLIFCIQESGPIQSHQFLQLPPFCGLPPAFSAEGQCYKKSNADELQSIFPVSG